MKKMILGTFGSRSHAEELIHHLCDDLRVPQDDIAYVYRDSQGDVREVDGSEVTESAPSTEVKAGAIIGGVGGVLLGFAMLIGLIPFVSPLLSGWPLLVPLGFGAWTLGIGVAGAVAGSTAGVIFGALLRLRLWNREPEIGEPTDGDPIDPDEDDERTDIVPSRMYRRRRNILVVTHAENDEEIGKIFASHGASSVRVYTPSL